MKIGGNRIRLMTPTNHYFKFVKTGTALILLSSIVLGIFLIKAWLALPESSSTDTPQKAELPTWKNQKLSPDTDWKVFVAASVNSEKAVGTLAKRFRLAGTYFVYSSDGKNARKAILDDLQSDTQHIVSEDDRVGHVKVVQVFRNRIVLRDKTHQEELWMSFSQLGDGSGDDQNGSAKAGDGEAFGSKKNNRFGVQQTGKRRWVMDRKKLMDYYQELMDDPERLVQVFDSLKPLYNEESKITGYQLGVEGESEFFDAVGFKEGDVVRSVNSIPMANRRRAEYFIKEFVNDRSNAFVLKVERGGTEEKFIYQVR